MVVTLDATDVMTTGNQFINHSEVTMSNRRPPGEVLLETAPYLRKWLNTCGACGQPAGRIKVEYRKTLIERNFNISL